MARPDARPALDVQRRTDRVDAGRRAGAGRAGTQSAARGDDPQSRRARAMRLGPGRHRRAAGLGRGAALSAQSGRRSARRRHRSEEARRQARPQARPGRTVLRAGLQDPGRPARRPALCPGLFGHAAGQQPRLQSRQGQEGKRPAAMACPGRPPHPGRLGRRRRHHRHRRPAPLDHRRHAVQPARADPAGIDHVSRDGHLDGHRARNVGRAQEAGRRARHDEAAGPDLPRPRKRGDRADA